MRPVDKALITHGHSDHARAGHGAVLATHETLDLMRAALWRQFCRHDPGHRLWRKRRLERRARHVSSGRPCARLGADRGRGRRPAHRRLGRLQGCRRSDLHAVRRRCRATCSSPKRRSACRCSATARPQAEIDKLLRSVALFPGARASRRRLFARQGAARDRDVARGGPRPADLSAWRARQDHALLRRAHGPWRSAARQRREEGRARRHDHAGAAVVAHRPVVAALSRSGHVVCVGLDARARPRAPARHRTAAGDFRSRRLGWAVRDASPPPARAKSG